MAVTPGKFQTGKQSSESLIVSMFRVCWSREVLSSLGNRERKPGEWCCPGLRAAIILIAVI